MIALVLDGVRVSVRSGSTLLEACREQGIAIPTLCHLDGTSEAGSCRLCLVEVRGLPRPVPACSTRALGGMDVRTDSAALRAHRRAVVGMLLASGEHVCAFCPASGRCELQELARELGVDHVERPDGRRARPLDASRARFALDPGRCILCTRCVRVCAEVEGAGTLHLVGRGARTRLATDGGERWAASATCTDCGKCVAACPTGALLEKAAASQGLAAASQGLAAAARRAEAPLARLPPGALSVRPRVATVSLGGCFGCHVSLVDLDERLLDLARRVDLVSSPLTDAKGLPDAIDVCLVEGALASEDHLALAARLRERARVVVALGDCASSGNVTALRDAAGGAGAVLRRAWRPGAAGPDLPALLPRVGPLRDAIDVDLCVPGCPPPPDLVHRVLSDLLAGRPPRLEAGARLG